MRSVCQSWWCGSCHTQNDPVSRLCSNCGHARYERHAQVHSSERAVVYYNPSTGDHRTPPRADMIIPQYEAQGFERREIMNMSQWEKQAGVVHEASNYSPGNEPCTEDPRDTVPVPVGLKEALVDDMREAFASGPWSGADKIV